MSAGLGNGKIDRLLQLDYWRASVRHADGVLRHNSVTGRLYRDHALPEALPFRRCARLSAAPGPITFIAPMRKPPTRQAACPRRLFAAARTTPGRKIVDCRPG